MLFLLCILVANFNFKFVSMDYYDLVATRLRQQENCTETLSCLNWYNFLVFAFMLNLFPVNNGLK